MPHSKFCHFNRKIQELHLGEEISRKISNLLLNNSSSSYDSDSSMTSEKALQMKRILMSLLMIKNYNLKY
ncbi:unnamed protein product [Brassica oleracea var. botrytis]|uniref:Uncharacterized protein n=1 Tax=Brassica oleracea TaxID=3712 RepID=A0A3P6ATY1_BRAOL|nr:unnamed protein product [Brassica oleracea]